MYVLVQILTSINFFLWYFSWAQLKYVISSVLYEHVHHSIGDSKIYNSSSKRNNFVLLNDAMIQDR